MAELNVVPAETTQSFPPVEALNSQDTERRGLASMLSGTRALGSVRRKS
jgi:hypothetical protein